jgi:alkylhydroperoxidase/carboxymuconolactone decarboxylase family protein YurZ
MPDSAPPPSTYERFTTTFPGLARAWEQVRDAEADGPLAVKDQRLLKLAVAVGALRQGAVHSAVRKARAAGAIDAEILQVVALAASTLGFPATVAVFTWVDEMLTG